MAREKIGEALAAYEEVRRVDVARIQNAARNAMEWFEVVGRRYADTLEPEQFMYSMLTRSQRISHENLRLRDPSGSKATSAGSRARSGLPKIDDGRPPPPMFTPYRVRGVTLQNRIVVSPMAMYSARDGLLERLPHSSISARARMGGAGSSSREMTCVSPDAPHHAGLPRPVERRAGRRLEADRRFRPFVGLAKVGLQLGHAGRKGSTRVAVGGHRPAAGAAATGR